MKPGVMVSQRRREILRVLEAHGDEKFTMMDLAERTGIPYPSVRDLLIRPTRCGWVSVTKPAQRGWGPTPRQQYQITEKGRQVLASLTTEE